MCQIFSGQDPARFEMVTRKVRLSGHSTSICLEAAFWAILEDIARQQDVSLGRFLSKLHEEVLARGVERRNFAGLLRCACLTYVERIREQHAAVAELEREAALAFPEPHAAILGQSRPSAAAS